MNFAKFLTTNLLKNTSGRLLLNLRKNIMLKSYIKNTEATFMEVVMASFLLTIKCSPFRLNKFERQPLTDGTKYSRVYEVNFVEDSL